jgi:hypothetical protein
VSTKSQLKKDILRNEFHARHRRLVLSKSLLFPSVDVK